MLRTKVFSVFIAFALIITIGGVYATWNYAEGNTVEIDYNNTYIGLTEVVNAGAKGVLSIDAGSNLAIALDDADNNYKAELNATGDIIVVFTPNDAIKTAIVGVDLQFKLTNHAALVFEGDPIFNVNETVFVSGETYGDIVIPDVVRDGDVFTWTIPASVFAQIITLNGDLLLDTVADYEIVDGLLNANSIAITFDECGVQLAE